MQSKDSGHYRDHSFLYKNALQYSLYFSAKYKFNKENNKYKNMVTQVASYEPKAIRLISAQKPGHMSVKISAGSINLFVFVYLVSNVRYNVVNCGNILM